MLQHESQEVPSRFSPLWFEPGFPILQNCGFHLLLQGDKQRFVFMDLSYDGDTRFIFFTTVQYLYFTEVRGKQADDVHAYDRQCIGRCPQVKVCEACKIHAA